LRVIPVAWTHIVIEDKWIDEPIGELIEEITFGPEKASGPDALAEVAGRLCYDSFHRPNEATNTNKKYLARTVGQEKHESILEHSSVTFYVDGVSRALLLELERHRFLSFSVRSQRYCDEDRDDGLVIPPLFEDDELATRELKEFYGEVRGFYRVFVDHFTSKGVKRKKAREAARAVLPNAQETKFFVTGNIRCCRDVIRRRHHEAADAEISIFAGEVLKHLRYIAPNSVQDIPDEPYS
jgi:thymidylate synthase (FAD)